MALDRKCEEMLFFYSKKPKLVFFFNLKSTELLHNIEGVILLSNVAHGLIRAYIDENMMFSVDEAGTL